MTITVVEFAVNQTHKHENRDTENRRIAPMAVSQMGIKNGPC